MVTCRACNPDHTTTRPFLATLGLSLSKPPRTAPGQVWLVTVVTAILLLGAMGLAMQKGLG